MDQDVGVESTFDTVQLWAKEAPNRPRLNSVSTLRRTNSGLRSIKYRKKIWNRSRTIDPIMGITSPQQSSQNYTWIIYDPWPHLCSALWEYFWDVSNVKIVCKPTLSEVIPEVDITPQACIFEGNVYGIKEPANTRWDELESIFGSNVINLIRDHVRSKYMGQAPLYTSFAIKTEHPTIRYIIYVASAVRRQENRHVFLSMWSALVTIQSTNNNIEAGEKKIDQFVIKAPFVSTLGEEESARQVFIAFYNFLFPPSQNLNSRNYMEAIEHCLNRSDTVINEDERLNFFIERLMAGDIEKRNFIDQSNVEILLSLFVDREKWKDKLLDDELIPKNVRRASARCLIKYAIPNEFFQGLRDTLITRPNALAILMKYVSKGYLKAHNEIDPKELVTGEKVAEGASGKVYMGNYKGEVVAVKTFSEEALSFSLEEFQREVAMMSFLKHENLIPFRGACTVSTKNLVIVTKFINGGSLYDRLHKSKEEFPFHLAVKVALETAKGMFFLHQKGVIHRDIKSLNIMLDEENGNTSVKIIDFGTSRPIDRNRDMTNAIGTVSYMSPEIFANAAYSEKADIYSYGLVLWEMIARKIPFHDVPGFNVPVMVTKGVRPEIPKETPEKWQKLMKACWDGKPKNRPSFKEIVESLTSISARESSGVY